jgi:hypothetical protein
LFTHYRQVAQLLKNKYFSLTELEEMIPFELGAYVDMINILKKEEKERNKAM